jgi:hypothetical protein
LKTEIGIWYTQVTDPQCCDNFFEKGALHATEASRLLQKNLMDIFLIRFGIILVVTAIVGGTTYIALTIIELLRKE